MSDERPRRDENIRKLLWDDRALFASLLGAGLIGAILGPVLGPVAWYIVGFGGLFALWQVHWADRLGLSGLTRYESRAANTLEEEERRARSHGSKPNMERILRAVEEDAETEKRIRQVKTTLALAMAALGFLMALVHS